MKRLLLTLIALAAPAMAQSVYNCSSFASTGTCGVSGGGQNFVLVGSAGGALSGSTINLIPTGSVHLIQAVNYHTTVNDQAFTSTFTFVPNGQNFAFVLQNNANSSQGTGSSFVSGAGCEAAIYQGFPTGPPAPWPDHIFAIEFDSYSPLTFGGSFSYSSVQLYQTGQSPCNPNDGAADYWPVSKNSSSPVNLGTGSQGTSTGDTYSATIAYDGTAVTLTMFDVTASGSCPGASCFTQTWTAVNIPGLVGSNTAYVGLMGATGLSSAYNLLVDSFSYTVNSAPGSQSLSTYTTSTAAGGGSNFSATPTFSPVAGSYAGTQSVTISSTTPSSYIIYTLSSTLRPQCDNFGGALVGTLYSGPVSIASTQTLNAMACTVATGLPSNVTQGVYTIGGGQATAPSCSPSSGSSGSPITVTCTNSNSGTTTMCYTENGATPISNGSGTGCSTGTSLSGSSNTITISSTVSTLNVIAGTSTLSDSTVSSYGPYTIGGGGPTGTSGLSGNIAGGSIH